MDVNTVITDVFSGARTPAHLTSTEFAAEAHRALRPGGLYAANVADGPPLRFARAQVATLRSVFRHVCLLAEPGTPPKVVIDEAIELVMAHACVFKGQWFGHIVVRHRGRLVSLLVTRLEDSSGIATGKEKLPKDSAAQVIACSTAGGFQISCFRTAQHGVFVVSDLEEGENLALARRLAPSLYEHITHAEQVT